MSIAQESPGDRRYRPWFRAVIRAAMWTGHHSLRVLAAWAAVLLASDLLGRPGWMTWVVNPVWVLWFFALGADAGLHQFRLCERCAAATPLDGDTSAARFRPVLRLCHVRGFYFWSVAACITWLLTMRALTGDHHWIWAYLLQDVPAFCLLGGYYVASRVHWSLQAWCPWCRWDEGGDEEPSPDVPAPVLEKT